MQLIMETFSLISYHLIQVDSGFVIVGTPVVIMPGGTTAMVKSMTTVDDKSVDYSVAGEQCILVLGGTDQTKVRYTSF